jgi:SAM-dependent methyltransferase
MDTETRVARHYSPGRLEATILDTLRASGKNVDALVTEDLAGLDEQHLGWGAATAELARDLDLHSGLSVLDVGAGLGGAARHFADKYGCTVAGVDLAAECVQVASALTQRCGLAHLVSFARGSAHALPFSSARFDVVTLMHVGMNIFNKAAAFAEVRRVLKPGGSFAVFDVMRLDASPLPYPLPWADAADMNFLETPDTYRRLLAARGFRIERERNRRDQALELGRAMRANATARSLPPLGPHVTMGSSALHRLANVMNVLELGSIAPIQMVARALPPSSSRR